MIKNNQQRRDLKRRKTVESYKIERSLRKSFYEDESNDRVERTKVRNQLRALPRDSSSTRVVNRCVDTGVARSVTRRFRRSRQVVLQLARKGELAGVKKASQ